MLTLKYRGDVKIVFVTLALVLMLFAEASLAKKSRERKSKPGLGNSKRQKVETTTAAPKFQRRPNVGKPRIKIAAPARSIRRQVRLSSSKLRDRSNFGRIVKPTVRQPSRVTPNRRAGKAASIHPATRRPKISLDVPKPSRGSFGGRGSAKAGSRAGKQAVVGSRNRIISVKTAHIGKSIRPSGTTKRKQVGVRSGNRVSSGSSSLFTRPANERSQHIRPTNERSQHIRPTNERSQHTRIEGEKRRRDVILGGFKRRHIGKRGFSTRGDRDHRPAARRIHRYEHVYRDRHDRICHRIIWPRYRFAVYYNIGRRFAFRYVYPYYHRKYVFVSLGGYWPVEYRYIRYYWYGYHPYNWYGYYPIGREMRGDTYNYYTYNYNYGDTAADGIKPVDHNTFADVREKLAQQSAEEPKGETPADSYFEDAVKAFEAGDYDAAAEMFARAGELAPDDMVLPFAYSQALFANEKYSEAAEVLRAALSQVSPEKEGVFYPRGLYADDAVLFEQIDRLTERAKLYSSDADLQLLLGYQLLGVGEIDKAAEPLRQASQDTANSESAAVLLELLEKIRTNDS